MRASRALTRLLLALLTSAALTAGLVPLATAAPVTTPQTYTGPGYSTDPGIPPTRPESQSKLWFHAGAWWALLLEPSGRTVRVFELMPDHTWRPTSAVISTEAGDVGDALHDGDTVHVVSRHVDDSVYYVRLAFDPATRDYRAAAPQLVADHGARAAVTIAKDTTGRLWVGYATAVRVVVTYSDDGVVWAPNIVLSLRETGGLTETAALVSYDDRIGILWSNQTTNSFEFASHLDGDDPLLWTREQALVGEAEADDHISLKRVDGDPSDTLVAAVKTSQGDRGDAPDSVLIKVIVRAPGGVWSAVPVSTYADGMNDPILMVDQTTRTLHLFASRDGSIVTKQASLDDIRFEPGIGNLFILGVEGGLLNPTGTKDPLDSRSGIVVLANDLQAHNYRHAEMPIVSPSPVVDPADVTPPEPPAALQGRGDGSGTVALSWDEVADESTWSPGRLGTPADQYVVLRDGVEIATVTTTSFRDEPGDGAGAAPAGSVEYQVLAVDQSGNRSAPASVVVDLTVADAAAGQTRVGIWLLVLAAVAVCVALVRPLAYAVRTWGRVGRHHDGRTVPGTSAPSAQ
jgi:hypothetical protein